MDFLKVDPLRNPTDICNTSLSLLGEKLKGVVSKEIWIPDEDLNYSNATDTVLLGGFLQRFFETGNWPDKAYRLWTCSSAAREVMVNLLGFQNHEVGMVSRYDLFKTNSIASNEFTLKDADFIFAGRLSPTKNLEGLILTLNYLQKNHGLNCRLHFYGDSDNMMSADRGRWQIDDYGQRISKLVKNLKWKKAPQFYGKVGHEEWLQKSYKNPVLVNFSTFMCEDFDVSLAQAQQKGWASIVSNWGGHQDQVLSNCMLLPWKLIGRSDEPETVVRVKSEILANYIMQVKPAKPVFHSQTVAPTKMVTKMRFESLRASVLEKLGPSSHRIAKEGMAAFADTDSGKRFFSLYRSFFGGKDSLPHIIITNDLNEKNPKIFESTMNALKGSESQVLLSSREVLHPENISLLGDASKIYFAFHDDNIAKIKKIVSGLAKKGCEIGSPHI